MVRTLKLSDLLSERDKLMTLLVASFMLEYHMRAPSERRTIVAFSVISSTYEHIVHSMYLLCMVLPQLYQGTMQMLQAQLDSLDQSIMASTCLP